ncbi:MAG TPA: 30S ribosomal protein S8 [Gammaproteobacteria bacterium]|nr:30S ribosomal protein S8 [Gammaproteobacteria bacterium]
MSMTDPIADLLTRIRNGQKAGKTQVRAPSSGIKKAILEVLRDEGYIEGFASEGTGKGKEDLVITLRYHDGEPVIDNLQRVSKPGRRVYTGKEDLPTVFGGLGVAIVSTSDGLMSDRQARAKGRGGEVICVVS